MKKQLIFRLHAVRRMFERRFSEKDVYNALISGDVIEEYPDDTPYPSYLVLAWCNKKPMHVVAAENPNGKETIIITVYEPDPRQWDKKFKRRKKH